MAALDIYYAGTAPPAYNPLLIQSPLNYNPQTNTLSLYSPFDAGYDFGAVNASQVIVPLLVNGPALGDQMTLIPGHTSTSTTPTVAVTNAALSGAHAIVNQDGSALAVGALVVNVPILMQFDGTYWRIVGSASAGLIQPQYGGTGQDWHASSGIPLFTSGVASLLSTTGTGSVVRAAGPTLTGLVDASGATQLKLPVAGGYTSAANGECGFDSTNGNWHCWVNGADALMIPLAGGFISGHCMQPTLSGTSWVGADAGAACGTGGGSGTMTDGAGSTTPGYFAITSGTAHAYTVDTNLDDGHTTVNTLNYAASGGIKASAGPLISGNPAGGVGSQFFLTQEGTAPSGLSAAGQDNCYADSTQHGLLCGFNAGSTLPLVQGPASSTANHFALFNSTNGGLLKDLGTDFVFNGTHTFSAGASALFDFSTISSTSGFKVPVIASATAAADGVIDYDSTAKLTHIRTNSADSIAAATTTTSTTTTQVLHATAVAGVYAPSAIVAADVPAALSSTTSVNGTTIPSSSTLAVTIASGTSAMGTGAITSGTCATVVTTTATGTATTDTITYTPNVDPTGVTGYAPSASGSLYIWAYPTTNNVNFKVCNNSSGSLTPSALTLNWRVAR